MAGVSNPNFTGDEDIQKNNHSHSHSHSHSSHGHSHENNEHSHEHHEDFHKNHGHSHDNHNDDHHFHGHEHEPRKKKFRITKTNSLVFMHILVGCFFLVELIVGHVTKSNALVADAFHMLSDVISLVIALIAVRMSDKTSQRNTFGWVRAEVLGSLVNSVFLLALCFSIAVEAINRFFEPKQIENVNLMLIVGGVGLFINLAGLAVFGMHDHEHGHGHSHGSSHDHGAQDKIKEKLNGYAPQINSVSVDIYTVNSDTMPIQELEDSGKNTKNDKKKKKSTRNMNMRGVFLHVLSDALGAVAVIISGLIIKYAPPEGQSGWKVYVDPGLSLIITILITSTTVPLLRDASLVLLQTVPSQFNIDDLKLLISKVPGVIDIHHFHVWSLNSEKLVASAHLRINKQNPSDEFKIIDEVKSLLHECDIHATTLQLEYDDNKPPGYNYDYCKENECRQRQCCINNESHN